MKKIILMAILALSSLDGMLAQDYNNHWQLGTSDLNFSSDPATNTTVSNSNQYGAVTVSDNSGNLLFYTDGIQIWNKNHVSMYGATFFGSFRSNTNFESQAQPALVIPDPGNSQKYYVFTTCNDVWIGSGTGPGYSYTYAIVDFSDPVYPLGKATVNTLVYSLGLNGGYSYGFRPMAYMKNSSNTGYFLVVAQFDTLYTYLVDSNGISLVQTFLNNTVKYDGDSSYPSPTTKGILKFSPDGTKLGELVYNKYFFAGPNIDYAESQFYTLNFNNTTGVLSSLTLIDNNAVTTGTTGKATDFEFSANSQKVYLIKDKVYVKDITNPATVARDLYETGTSIVPLGFNHIQKDVYGNILLSNTLATSNRNKYLHVIDNQDSFTSSSITMNYISLNGNPIPNTYVYSGSTRSIDFPLPSLISTGPCPLSLTVTTNVTSGNDSKQAMVLVSASNSISSGANAIYHAGESVLLTTGFRAVNGSKFRGYIEGCTGNFLARFHNPTVDSDSQTKEGDFVPGKDSMIYPNPSESTATIAIKNNKISSITIVRAIDSRIVFTQKIKNESSCEINVSSFQKGIYFVSIETPEGKIVTEKLIKK